MVHGLNNKLHWRENMQESMKLKRSFGFWCKNKHSFVCTDGLDKFVEIPESAKRIELKVTDKAPKNPKEYIAMYRTAGEYGIWKLVGGGCIMSNSDRWLDQKFFNKNESRKVWVSVYYT